MAKLIQALNELGPRVEYQPRIDLKEAAEWMTMRTGINRSEVMMMLQELSELIVYFNRQGRAVKLPGVGIFRPTVDRNGRFKIGYRADNELRNGVNTPGAYTGPIANRARIGLSDEEYKLLWDRLHPDDPLEL